MFFQPAKESTLHALVRCQLECGIHVVNDGECGRPNFHVYAAERLSGFERRVPPGGVPVRISAWFEHDEPQYTLRDEASVDYVVSAMGFPAK